MAGASDYLEATVLNSILRGVAFQEVGELTVMLNASTVLLSRVQGDSPVLTTIRARSPNPLLTRTPQ